MNRTINILSTSRTAVILLLATLLTATVAQTAAADSTFSGGDGSQSNPYKIANETDLRQLATDVNGGNSYSGKFFQQSQNITLTQNFTSIGCYKSNSQGGSKSFSGTYDGGNKTISGLTINGSTNMQGLFGRVENATIQNLTLSGASVTNSASYVGAFVGYSNGGLTMTNCHAVNCNVKASNNDYVAIFVGYLTSSASTIKSCTVSGGSVSGNNKVGAIVGYAYGSSNVHAIVGCVARGVTGGDNLIGTNTNSCVRNVASYGNNDYTITAGTGVTITYSAVSDTYSDIIHPPYIKAGETVPVTLSYTGSLSNVTYHATGATLNDEGTQLSNAQGNVTITATEATKTDISGGSIADIALQTWTGSALTPALTVTVGGKTLTAATDYLVNYTDNTHIGTATATVTGTGAYKGTLTKTFEIRHSDMPFNSTGNFYEIGNETALRALSSYVGSGGETSGRTFKQTEDITLTSSFSPIGISDYYQFHGIYDGNNKTISGLSVSGNVEYAALFGYMQFGTVKDVILISPSVSSSYKYGARVSALVGYMNADAIIDNCIVINPTLSATGQGNNSVGIFIGVWDSSCSISNCYYYDGNTEHNYAAYQNNNHVPKYSSATNILRVYAVNASGCTATATPTISVGGTDYYKEGTAVTLSLSGGTAPEGYLFGGYTVNGTAIDGNTFTIGSEDATITATISIDPAQFSQDGDTYTIHTAGGWNVFCDMLAENAKGYFTSKTVVLANDITVTRMAGSDNHEFTGTFDGDGKTLTVNYANTGNDTRTAPFSYVDGATIQNLIVGGTISGTAYRAAGIIGETVNTTSHITNCVSNVDISSGRYTGGFSIGGNVEIEGCVFNGKINGTTYSGGFIGYSYSAQVIKNSLFAPQDGSSISGGTFYYNGGGDVAPVNSYYTQALGTAQGKACHSVTAGTDVTIDAIALTGTATQYTVSGITAYSGGGLQRGQTLYYGSDDQLSLTLSNTATAAPRGYQYGYTASAGTLSGSTLTMPDQDVTISVNTAALAPIDWATVNQGNSADPYMIYNKDQLLLLAHRVNGTNGETANDYEPNSFKLGADITFTYDADEGDDYDENYEAIGGYYNSTYRYFKGIFDGDGHTVSGIRIRKTGSGNADNCQGLFGCISSGADIHDVHLTDARIKGCQNVGGIVGYNNASYIWRCSVTDSYITATDNWNYGTICGRTDNTNRLINNYYHGCTVNSTENATNVGCGGSEIADLTANHGALPAYRLDLGENITTPPGTFAGQTVWLDTPPVNPRLAPENGFTLAGNHYFASGYVFTPGSTLASGAAQGYTPRATLGGQLLDLYTPTGDPDPLAGKAIARLTITADCDGKTLASTQAIYSTREPVTVAYINADGTTGEASAIALDGTETSLAAGTYFVGTDIAYANPIWPDGDVTLILADGKTMTLNGNMTGIAGGRNLTIYGQSLDDATAGTLRYDGKSDGINADNYEQHSGNVSITTTGSWVRGIDADVTLRGGTLTVTANGDKAHAISGNTHSILGGHLTATATGTNAFGISATAGSGTVLTLSWTRPADRITASSISTPDGGTVAVADGQALTDGSGHIYTGTLTASVLSGIDDETTLQPCLALADAADNTAAITDHAGQTLAVALSGRTLSKSGEWNTLCLPFAVSSEQLNESSNPLNGATIKALDAANSNLSSDGTLTLKFAEATSIEAGKPYIVKWTSGEGTVSNPVFEGVTIAAAAPVAVEFANNATAGLCQFVGQFSPFTIVKSGATGDNEGNQNEIILMGAGSKLGYAASVPRTLRSFRAHFMVPADGTTGAPVNGFMLDFGDGEVTSISTTNFTNDTNGTDAGNGWHSLDGRKLAGQPARKGVYIHGGRKVVVSR